MIKKNIKTLLFLVLVTACNQVATQTESNENIYKTINYDDGLTRKGFYLDDKPLGIHKYYRSNSLEKVIEYIDWDEEYLSFLENNSEKYFIYEIDSSRLLGHPNCELYIYPNNGIDTSKSSFIAYDILLDTSIRIKANVSRFDLRPNKWVHLFLFMDEDVRYIVKDTFDFVINVSQTDMQMIKNEKYTFYSMILVDDSKVSYTHMKPIDIDRIRKDLEKE